MTGEVPWPAWLGVAFAIVIFVGAQVIASLILWIIPDAAGWTRAKTTDWLQNSLAAQLSYIFLASGLSLGGIYALVRPYGRTGFHSIGLKKPQWIDPLYGLLALPVYLLTYVGILSLVLLFAPHLNLDQKQELGFDGNYSGLQLVPVFISLVVLPPLTEEIVFRGVLYSSFKKLLSLWPAVLLTSLLFAAGHLAEGGSGGPLYIAAIDTFTLSLILIYLREKTGRLWASMTLHALKNLIAFVTLFLLHAR